MIKELTVLANHLDSKGLRKEADYLDRIISKVAEIDDEERAILDGLESLMYSRDPAFNADSKELRDCMEKTLREENQAIIAMTKGTMDYSFGNEKDLISMYESARSHCMEIINNVDGSKDLLDEGLLMKEVDKYTQEKLEEQDD